MELLLGGRVRCYSYQQAVDMWAGKNKDRQRELKTEVGEKRKLRKGCRREEEGKKGMS